MPLQIITGGQAGADQGAWRAARALGLATGGWMPRGFRTEAGPRPEFAALYGATEHPSAAYPPRTKANVGAADLSLVFNLGPAWSAGTVSATKKARSHGIPAVVVELARTAETFAVARLHRAEADGSTDPVDITTPEQAIAAVRTELARPGVAVLHVGGNREDSTPGIGEYVERFLVAALGDLPG